MRRLTAKGAVREAVTDAVLALARLQIAECKAQGVGVTKGPQRRRADDQIRKILNRADAPNLHT